MSSILKTIASSELKLLHDTVAVTALDSNDENFCVAYFGAKIMAIASIAIATLNTFLGLGRGLAQFVNRICLLDISGAFKGLAKNFLDSAKSVALIAVLVCFLVVSIFFKSVFKNLKSDRFPLTAEEKLNETQKQLDASARTIRSIQARNKEEQDRRSTAIDTVKAELLTAKAQTATAQAIAAEDRQALSQKEKELASVQNSASQAELRYGSETQQTHERISTMTAENTAQKTTITMLEHNLSQIKKEKTEAQQALSEARVQLITTGAEETDARRALSQTREELSQVIEELEIEKAQHALTRSQIISSASGSRSISKGAGAAAISSVRAILGHGPAIVGNTEIVSDTEDDNKLHDSD